MSFDSKNLDKQEQRQPQNSRLHVKAGGFSIEAEVSVTPKGLLAIAALVSSILLSTAVLVQAAKK